MKKERKSAKKAGNRGFVKNQKFRDFSFGLYGTSDGAIGTKWLLKRFENALETFWASFDQN